MDDAAAPGRNGGRAVDDVGQARAVVGADAVDDGITFAAEDVLPLHTDLGGLRVVDLDDHGLDVDLGRRASSWSMTWRIWR